VEHDNNPTVMQPSQPMSSDVFDLKFGSSTNTRPQSERSYNTDTSNSPFQSRVNRSSTTNSLTSGSSYKPLTTIPISKTTNQQQSLGTPSSNASNLQSELFGMAGTQSRSPRDNNTGNTNIFSGMQMNSSQQTHNFHQPLIPTQVGADPSATHVSQNPHANFQQPLIPTPTPIGTSQYPTGSQFSAGHQPSHFEQPQPSRFQQPLLPTQMATNTQQTDLGAPYYGTGMSQSWTTVPPSAAPNNAGLTGSGMGQVNMPRSQGTVSSNQWSSGANSWSTATIQAPKQNKPSNESNPFADLSFLG